MTEASSCCTSKSLGGPSGFRLSDRLCRCTRGTAGPHPPLASGSRRPGRRRRPPRPRKAQCRHLRPGDAACPWTRGPCCPPQPATRKGPARWPRRPLGRNGSTPLTFSQSRSVFKRTHGPRGPVEKHARHTPLPEPRSTAVQPIGRGRRRPSSSVNVTGWSESCARGGRRAGHSRSAETAPTAAPP